MREEYLARMEHIALMGGNITLDLISNRTYYLKSDKSVLTEADLEISQLERTAISDLLTTPDHILFDWNFSDCQLMNPLCAVLSLCWPAIGRGCGAFFGAHIWDFAGAWPFFLSAGLSLLSYWSGKEIDKVAPELFVREGNDPWRLKKYYILSSERNFPLLREKITPKHQR